MFQYENNAHVFLFILEINSLNSQEITFNNYYIFTVLQVRGIFELFKRILTIESL